MLWIVTNIISHLAVQSVPTSTARPVTKSCPETGDCHENPFLLLPRDHITALNQWLAFAIRELHPGEAAEIRNAAVSGEVECRCHGRNFMVAEMRLLRELTITERTPSPAPSAAASPEADHVGHQAAARRPEDPRRAPPADTTSDTRAWSARRCATRSMTGTASRCSASRPPHGARAATPRPCPARPWSRSRAIASAGPRAGSASEQPAGAAATTDMTEAEEGHLARSARTGSRPLIAEPCNRHRMTLSSSSAAPGQSATNAENTAWRQCPPTSPRIPPSGARNRSG